MENKMNDYELLFKRVLPTLCEDYHKQELKKEDLLDIMKVARAMEPDEETSPIIIGRVFNREGDDSKKLREKAYSLSFDNFWFAALDLTEKRDPKKPILGFLSSIYEKKGFTLPYVFSIGQEFVTPFYDSLASYFNFIDLKQYPNLFETRNERANLYYFKKNPRKLKSMPQKVEVIKKATILKDDLKQCQEKIHLLLEEKENMEKTLAPLEAELKEVKSRINKTKKPISEKIEEYEKELKSYGEPMDLDPSSNIKAHLDFKEFVGIEFDLDD